MLDDFILDLRRREYPYVIAELGSNHNGDMKIAERLIREAKIAGADCVKFQSWTKGSIFSEKVYEENVFLKDDYRNRTDYTLEKIVDEFSISEQELGDMKILADRIGIEFASTPFSKSEADFLRRLNVRFIKIASMDLNNLPYLEYVASFKKPMLLSTGLSELYEIDVAVRTIEKAGNDKIAIMHCVSLYPPKDEEVNLLNIATLKSLYDYPIGFSDHTLGTSIPLAAVALGAKVIEKHFTLDKNMFGWDHKVSANPEEMTFICQESKRIKKAMGSTRIYCEEDARRISEFRRSIVSKRRLLPGEVITAADLDYKRPGSGISPAESPYVIGRKVKSEIARDRLIRWEDLI